MRIDGNPRKAPPVECPYLPGQTFVQEYFFGDELNTDEMGFLLSHAWRRFGSFFFRPDCPGCKACQPLRIPVKNLRLTDSQKRVMKKNLETDIAVRPLEFREEHFEIYQNHSQVRFGKEADPIDFQQTFYTRSAPAFITEYRVKGRMAAVGFCDRGSEGLSSVYFVFHEDFRHLSLGIYSILRECRLAEELGLDYYYLGYFVQGNDVMQYKGQFHPHQIRDWGSGQWEDES